MNQLLDKFLEQSVGRKIAILAGIICLTYGLYFSFVYSPNSDTIANLVESVQIARDEKLSQRKKGWQLGAAWERASGDGSEAHGSGRPTT